MNVACVLEFEGDVNDILLFGIAYNPEPAHGYININLNTSTLLLHIHAAELIRESIL